MNPNDLLPQLQALLNQAQQQNQHFVCGYLALQVGSLLLVGWVVFMFYARLRDIAEELKKLRVAYEFAHTAETRAKIRQASANEAAGNPFAGEGSDKRYMPKT